MIYGLNLGLGRTTRAFSRVELVVILGALFTLLLVVLPLFANTALRSDQTGCLNNLRQIGIGFQAWGTDYNDQRPWFVPASEGGSRLHPLRDNAAIHFSFLSNYIAPTILIDPAEMARNKRMASNWSSGQGGFLNPGFGNNALSYMLSLHTWFSEAHNILAADRHVQFDGPTTCPVGGGTQVQRLGAGPFFRGWTNGSHGLAGNLLLNDGNVEFASQAHLKAVVTRPDDGFVGDHVLTPF